MELDRRQPVELLVVELAERDLHGALQAARGDKVGDVAGIAYADLLEGLAIRGKVAFHPRKVSAEKVLLAFAFFVILLRLFFGRRAAWEAESAGRWLHGVVFGR